MSLGSDGNLACVHSSTLLPCYGTLEQGSKDDYATSNSIQSAGFSAWYINASGKEGFSVGNSSFDGKVFKICSGLGAHKHCIQCTKL